MVKAVEDGFELSEASNTPVMLELRIRACHVTGRFDAKQNKRPDLTEERFITIELPGGRSQRVYDTGDRGEYQANNLIIEGVLYTPSTRRKLIDSMPPREKNSGNGIPPRSARAPAGHDSAGSYIGRTTKVEKNVCSPP